MQVGKHDSAVLDTNETMISHEPKPYEELKTKDKNLKFKIGNFQNVPILVNTSFKMFDKD